MSQDYVASLQARADEDNFGRLRSNYCRMVKYYKKKKKLFHVVSFMCDQSLCNLYIKNIRELNK